MLSAEGSADRSVGELICRVALLIAVATIPAFATVAILGWSGLLLSVPAVVATATIVEMLGGLVRKRS